MAIKTEEDFIALVQKAEEEAKNSPKAYKIKLTLFALLGYLVIFLMLFSLIGLIGGLAISVIFGTALILFLVKTKLIFAVIVGIWVLIRALWVKFTPPEGYTLKRQDYPTLFTELDKLSKQLKAPKIHAVILDQKLNAAIAQHPRLGILGWNRNYLILGYQLMLTLSQEEMRSVLAHEFGHLSGNHSRLHGWIYRVRQTWLRIMYAFDTAESWGGKLMHKFFHWYSPQFEAYSFALARSNEFEADAIAASLTSPAIATRALINVHATAPYLDEQYWEKYFRQADDHAQPSHPPFAGLSTFLKERPLLKKEMIERIKKEMQVSTHYSDTHPSLKERVRALSAQPQLPEPPKISAAESWLGRNHEEIRTMFDEEWLQNNSEAWQQRYEYVSTAKQGLQTFQQTPINSLTDKDLWDYAYWTHEFKNSEQAMPLFLTYQQRHPHDPDAAFFIGNHLLKNQDASGLDNLRIARQSPHLLESSTHAGYQFLNEQGQEQQAEQWWQQSIEQQEIFAAANAEREQFTVNDEVIYPTIDDDTLQSLVGQLKTEKNVGKVWLAQKIVQHYPDDPAFIIVFSVTGLFLSYERVQKRVTQNIRADQSIFVLCKSGHNRKLVKKVIKVGKRIL